MVSILLVGVLLGLAGQAEAVSLTRGRFSFGLGGGFTTRSVTVGGSFGYLVADGLVPSISQAYTWQGGDGFDAHRLSTSLELRYYFIQTGTIAPYVFADTGHIFLAFRGVGDEDHNYFTVGGGLGVLFILGEHLGLQLGVRLGTWLGADQSLYDREVLDDGLVISGVFGLSLIL